MPLFSGLIASLFSGLVGFLARFLSLQLAQKIAAYAMYITVTVALLTTTLICLRSLFGMISGLVSGGGSVGVGWVRFFFMGVGMFIPANAVAVMSCIASVWVATGIYKVQKQGLANYGS